MIDIWLNALADAHRKGAHGTDDSRYWEREGCSACREARTVRLVTPVTPSLR